MRTLPEYTYLTDPILEAADLKFSESSAPSGLHLELASQMESQEPLQESLLVVLPESPRDILSKPLVLLEGIVVLRQQALLLTQRDLYLIQKRPLQ